MAVTRYDRDTEEQELIRNNTTAYRHANAVADLAEAAAEQRLPSVPSKPM